MSVKIETTSTHSTRRQPHDQSDVESAIATGAASHDSVWRGDSEPDVTWGEGGIDDWGWSVLSRSSASEQPHPDAN